MVLLHLRILNPRKKSFAISDMNAEQGEITGHGLDIFVRWVLREYKKSFRDSDFLTSFRKWHIERYGESYEPGKDTVNS